MILLVWHNLIPLRKFKRAESLRGRECAENKTPVSHLHGRIKEKGGGEGSGAPCPIGRRGCRAPHYWVVCIRGKQ